LVLVLVMSPTRIGSACALAPIKAMEKAAAAMDVNNPEILDTGFLPMSRCDDVSVSGDWS
jgi:hypothetical protein